MKKTIWQALMPHVIAVVIFLIVALIISKPGLESDVVMKQQDISGWQGMSHQSYQYKEKHGHTPLWVTNMFSGMPGFQVAMEGPWTVLSIFSPIFQLGLPKPMNWFFLACICFYFMCQCLKVRPWISIIGSIAFAYCSFNPIIITVGHETQMYALAYAPAVIGSVLLLFDKKYISGFVATALFTAIQIAQGHQQISYYLFLIIAIMSLFLLIQAVKRKETVHFAKSIGLAVVAAIIGIMVNAVLLLTTYDYSKESKRGGQLVLNEKEKGANVVSNNKTKGLSKEYAFDWSYGIDESLTLMFPGVKGYGLHIAERDGEPYYFPKLDENSHVAKYLTEKLNAPEDQATNFAFQTSYALYWGGQPNTNGPVYIGAVICALFIFSMFYLKGPHKWWILTATIAGIMMAWGKHFAAFNYFLFDYVPLYNKFRAPTMALVIPQIVIPIAVVLGLEKLISDKVIDLKAIRDAGLVTAFFIALAGILYFTWDYSNENKQRTAAVTAAFTANNPNLRASMDSINARFAPLRDNQLYERFLFQMKGDATVARGIITAAKQDRQAAFGSDLMRTLLFVVLTAGLVFLFIKKKVNTTVFLAGIGLLTVIDLLQFDTKYLNSFSFDSKDKYEATEFPLTAADQTILKDPDPNFRVYNQAAGLEESLTSYYHKSIGGYHPAKLGIYDDLIQYQLSGDPNPNVINMLNTKYVIQQNPQDNSVAALRNPGALGNVWFVRSVKYVKGPAEEIPNTFTAPDSTASIKQVAFDNDAIKYESNSSGTHLAVFSEIYYKDWKAYIDGKPAEYGKADYVLRAMVIPAGKHTIDFKFEPQVFYTGSTLTTIGSWIIILLVLGYIGWLLLPVIKKNKAVA
jgi:hypothetical protein